MTIRETSAKLNQLLKYDEFRAESDVLGDKKFYKLRWQQKIIYETDADNLELTENEMKTLIFNLNKLDFNHFDVNHSVAYGTLYLLCLEQAVVNEIFSLLTVRKFKSLEQFVVYTGGKLITFDGYLRDLRLDYIGAGKLLLTPFADLEAFVSAHKIELKGVLKALKNKGLDYLAPVISVNDETFIRAYLAVVDKSRHNNLTTEDFNTLLL